MLCCTSLPHGTACGPTQPNNKAEGIFAAPFRPECGAGSAAMQMFEHLLQVLQGIRREQPEAREGKPDRAETNRPIDQRQHAGDHRSRRQHDADLKGCGGQLVIVIFCEIQIA